VVVEDGSRLPSTIAKAGYMVVDHVPTPRRRSSSSNLLSWLVAREHYGVKPGDDGKGMVWV
jgi:hypothetical protein